MAQRLSVAEAAARLGLTETALRQRVARRKVSAERVEGRLYVLLPDVASDATGHDMSHRMSPPSSPQQSPQDGALVAELRGRVAFLEEELTARRREVERLHTLLAQAQQRPALPSGAAAAVQPVPSQASWWRRLFSGEK